METKLARIREIAASKPTERFTSLTHLLDEKMLKACHEEQDSKKAAGVDGVAKHEYATNLEENIKDLVNRLKRKAYRPKPVKRVYIDKDGGKSKRPLGIPAYEDKLVQAGLTKILQAVYEPRFLDLSYGYRPGRSCHDALKQLNAIIQYGKTNYIVEADIRGFFDNVDHSWLIRFIENDIADPNIKRLIVRILKSGVMENTVLEPTAEGTPQGGNISPVLANIYLHYVLDIWFEKAVKKGCRGAAEMVRFADDYVCCFQDKNDAERFLVAMKNRLAKFNLEIAEDKTKMFMFGRHAEEICRNKGKKPETFNFLGFTHRCGRSRDGRFRVKRETSAKKFKAKLRDFKNWIRASRNNDISAIVKTVKAKLIGHYRYYGITDNTRKMNEFRYLVLYILYKWLNRRSQRRSFTWEKYQLFLDKCKFPYPKIYVNIYG